MLLVLIKSISNEYPQHMFSLRNKKKYQGPVVQSIVSITSSLVVKMLNAQVGTVSNSQLFLLKKCE